MSEERTPGKRWTASELRKLPAAERDAILEAAAALAEEEYRDNVQLPGQHSCDPYIKDIDPIAFALARLQVHLLWIDEHRSSFEKSRHTDPTGAENELGCLRRSTEEALAHLHGLTELLQAGYTIDPNKRLPKSLLPADWLRSYLKRLQGG